MYIPRSVGEWLLEVAASHHREIGVKEVHGAASRTCVIALVASKLPRLPVVCIEDEDLSADTRQLLTKQQ